MTEYVIDYPYNSEEPIWSKRIDGHFTLFEFPKENEEPNCIVFYSGDNGDEQFNFNGWGGDREEITLLSCTFCRNEMNKRSIKKTQLTFWGQLDLFLASIDPS